MRHVSLSERKLPVVSGKNFVVKGFAVTDTVPQKSDRRSLREQVEALLPTWPSWYPSLFDAAADLGLIRARVCSPSSLMLSNRHASVQSEAMQMFKEKWSVEDEADEPQLPIRLQRQPTPRKPFKKKPRPSY
jgi:hypothetical protein